MKGNIKAWNYLVAIWFSWTTMFGSNWVLSVLVVQDPSIAFNPYDKVNFTTVYANSQSYTNFLQSLRHKLASGDKRYGIPVLSDPSNLPDYDRFLLACLSNWENKSVALALDVTNAAVVGYGAESQFFFFNNTVPNFSTNFEYSQQRTLPFGSSYSEIERAAGVRRAKIDLGIMALDQAISSLYNSNNSQQTTVARSLIVAIQMVSDAMRFKDIEQQVRWSTRSNRRIRPDARMLSLQNKWTTLSNAIQKSNEGVFSSPVQLQLKNSTLNVDNVNPQLVSTVALMVFVCNNQEPNLPLPNEDGVCAKPEPTVHLIGRSNLCIDVRHGKYGNGNTIQLYPCKSNTDVNQLWTLKRDGTIQSNGMCLTTIGFNPGSNVTIYDCATATADAANWQVWENGTIINPKSGLVLTATSESSGISLTLETNVYASNQAWLASNNSEPFVTTIVGFKDLCLQANEIGVWLIECVSYEEKQKWAIYADSTIRPRQKQGSCLSCENHVAGTVITIASCIPRSSGQRWVFKNDGTILNLYNRMVLDVKQSDPSLEQIIIWPFTGNPNQNWLPLLL